MPRTKLKSQLNTQVKVIKITWKRCTVCDSWWAYSNSRPGVFYCTVRCPKCRGANERWDRMPDPTPEEIEKRTEEIRKNWDEREHQRRYQRQDNVQRVELKPVKIRIEE